MKQALQPAVVVVGGRAGRAVHVGCTANAEPVPGLFRRL